MLEPLELGSTWLLDTWYDCWEMKSGSLQVEHTLLTLSHLSSPSSSCMCVHVSVYVCVHRKGGQNAGGTLSHHSAYSWEQGLSLNLGLGFLDRLEASKT